MGQIGSFGNIIIFEVNSDKILTPKNVRRKVSGRWKSHNVLNKKPKLEFAGSDSDEVTFEVVLNAEHGVPPRSTLNKIEKAIKNGTAAFLSIGGKLCGSNKMVITGVSEDWDTIWNNGELVKTNVKLTFQEYT